MKNLQKADKYAIVNTLHPPYTEKDDLRHKALQLLFPMRCVYCNCQSASTVCPACAKQLPKLVWQGEFPQRMKTAYLCGVFSRYSYRGVARQGLLNFKFGHRAVCAQYYGRELAAALKTQLEAGTIPVPQLVIPVPESHAGHSRYEYSVPRLLAEVVTQELRMPKALCTNILLKRHDTLPQHRLPYLRRLANLAGAYEVYDADRLAGKTVWLVDDVITTGSTVLECAKMLWLYGAAQVFAVSFCADPPPQQAQTSEYDFL